MGEAYYGYRELGKIIKPQPPPSQPPLGGGGHFRAMWGLYSNYSTVRVLTLGVAYYRYRGLGKIIKPLPPPGGGGYFRAKGAQKMSTFLKRLVLSLQKPQNNDTHINGKLIESSFRNGKYYCCMIYSL